MIRQWLHNLLLRPAKHRLEVQLAEAKSSEVKPVLKVHSETMTLCGGRSNNEDFAASWSPASGTFLCLTADGLGGYAGGEFASEIAVKAVIDWFKDQDSLENPSDLLKIGFERANLAVISSQSQHIELERMRTTLVGLFIHEGAAWWGHIGDSRLYHIREGSIIHQTMDHSVVQLLLTTGEIQLEEVRRHPDRNRLLRVIGSMSEYRPAFQETGIQLKPEDKFVLCTDGFWELIPEADLLAELDSQSAEESARSLMQMALDRGQGDFDNLTLQVVSLTEHENVT